VEFFRIGFSDRTLGRVLTDHGTMGAEVRAKLAKLGIFQKNGQEHFGGCITFFVTLNGKTTWLYGRKIGDRLGQAHHVNLSRPQHGVWNEAGIQGEDLILCEAIIDALTFWINGIRNVTASYGINGFTDDHLALFKSRGIKRVFIAYDRDQAGDKGAETLSEKLMAEGFECLRVIFPNVKDANELAQASDNPARDLALALNTADWIGKGRPTALPPEPQPEPEPNPAAESAPEETPKKENPPQQEQTTGPGPVKTTATEKEVVLEIGDRTYRVRGLAKNSGLDTLKAILKVTRGDRFHVDTFDLYQARPRDNFTTRAAAELGLDPEMIKADLGQVLRTLEEIQESHLAEEEKTEKPSAAMTGKDRENAMALLKDPNLLDRILEDFERCGVVGEETNKLVGYLAAATRKLEEPLAILIQSTSAAGKSSLMEAILAFMPEEDQVKYSAMTGQSLFYMNNGDLKNKILAIAEEEGAARASYPLKLLQSEGELTIASTGKDPETGKLQTDNYHVQGPVMLFLTTTGIDIDNELLNRCLVLTVDEDRDQTQAIHDRQRQRQTLSGILNRQEKQNIIRLHRNAQRLIQHIVVANPFAMSLTFPSDRTRTRRDHLKYLTLIRAVTLLHQYQRPIKTVSHEGKPVRYIEVTLQDIEIANRLSHEALGRTLDELPPHTRAFLYKIENFVLEKCTRLKVKRPDLRFTRRELRDHSGLHQTQLKAHLDRLVDMEYLVLHHGRCGQTMVYELAYQGEGKDGKPFLIGLADAKQLKRENLSGLPLNLSGQNDNLSARCRGDIGPLSGGCRSQKISLNPHGQRPDHGVTTKTDEKGIIDPEKISTQLNPAGVN